MTGAIHVARAARQHQATIDALAVPASDLSWKFAFEDAIEAGMEAENFHRENLSAFCCKERFTDGELAQLMRAEYQYQDMSRHSRCLMDALLLRPAPDSAALLWKLEYALGGRRGYGSSKPLPETAVAHILSDARRLLGGEGGGSSGRENPALR